MQKFGVIGYPLTHSLSPDIHNYAFQKLKIDASYKKIEISQKNFKKEIRDLKSSGMNGLNITIPYKLKIISFLDQIDSDAQTIGAVNTIVKKDNRWIGYNTDVVGFLTPLLDFKNKVEKCLVLGTGGASRAVIYTLSKYFEPQVITVAGRNPEKSALLSSEFSSLFKNIRIDHRTLTDSKQILPDYNLIVNTTPLGMFPDVDQTPLPTMNMLTPKTIVYDLVYNPIRTKLLSDAVDAGKDIVVINGMEMLIQQAAGSFKLWTHQDMPVDEVREFIINHQ
jgi:shikimate dehydrogenase